MSYIKSSKKYFRRLLQSNSWFEYLTFNMKINEFVIKMQIYDIWGQEIYNSLIPNFYRNSSLALILYSIDIKKVLNM